MNKANLADATSPTNVEDYGWKGQNPPCSCDFIGPQIIHLVKKLRLQRVLDLGCGNGALCSMLKDAGCEVVGVEVDRNGYELARKFYPHIHFYNYGVQDEPMTLMASEAPFDAVISTEVIEHLFSPHLLPLYARATMQKNGYLIVSTPYHGYLKNLALSILNKWDFHHSALWHGGHIKFWSRKTLTQLLGNAGFRVVGFHGVGRAPYLWKSMIVVAERVT